MSGGVDSSVVAALLHEAGHEVIGVTMHLWDASGDQKVGRCCAPEDREDARAVCDLLGVPHYVIDEREAFERHVVTPFVQAYQSGQTPSPCVSCNQHVKLGRFLELAHLWGADAIATGHYARIDYDENERITRLRRGLDLGKDQSYFLFGVPQEVLNKLWCPLGAMQKDEARLEAARLGLPNAQKPDSQELCFVPDGRVGHFIDQRTRLEREPTEEERGTEGLDTPRAKSAAEKTQGRFLDPDGKTIGLHPGIHHFTIGQRRGLGLGAVSAQQSPDGKARYVLKITPDSQDVVVGPEKALYSGSLSAQGRDLDAERP